MVTILDATPVQNLLTAKPLAIGVLMNANLSPEELQKELTRRGYSLIAVNVPSPVGPVPKGSTVITDHEEKRAYWIDGKLFQHPKAK